MIHEFNTHHMLYTFYYQVHITAAKMLIKSFATTKPFCNDSDIFYCHFIVALLYKLQTPLSCATFFIFELNFQIDTTTSTLNMSYCIYGTFGVLENWCTSYIVNVNVSDKAIRQGRNACNIQFETYMITIDNMITNAKRE